jgi:thiol-disulfide isomerase/thioredoxin
MIMKKNSFLLLALCVIASLASVIICNKFSVWPCKKSSPNSHSEDNSSTHTSNFIKEITTESQLEDARKDTLPVVIKFYADWCGGCQYMQTYFPALAESFKDKVHFYAINADNEKVMTAVQESNLTKEPIHSLPTLVLLQNGNIHKQIVGVKEFAELETEIIRAFYI